PHAPSPAAPAGPPTPTMTARHPHHDHGHDHGHRRGHRHDRHDRRDRHDGGLAQDAGSATEDAIHPDPVRNAMTAALVLTAAFAINLVCARMLHGHHHNINGRAAYLHVLADALGSVAALAAGAIVWLTGWYPADPLLSFVVSALMLFSIWRLLRQSTNVLMEG